MLRIAAQATKHANPSRPPSLSKPSPDPTPAPAPSIHHSTHLRMFEKGSRPRPSTLTNDTSPAAIFSVGASSRTAGRHEASNKGRGKRGRGAEVRAAAIFSVGESSRTAGGRQGQANDTRGRAVSGQGWLLQWLAGLPGLAEQGCGWPGWFSLPSKLLPGRSPAVRPPV